MKMRSLSVRRHQLFNFWTRQLAVCVIIASFLCVSYLQKVECASLIQTHHLQQHQPQLLQPQDFIIDDDGLVLLPLTSEKFNNGLRYPVPSNPNNHNMITRMEAGNGKQTRLMRKRNQNYQNYDLQDQAAARNKAVANLVNVIPDSELLKLLLKSELFSTIEDDEPGAYEQRIQKPKLGYNTYPARQKQIPREQFQAEKRQGSGCLFHGGLAHNCDYKDLVGAVDEADHWGSDLSPGKSPSSRKTKSFKIA